MADGNRQTKALIHVVELHPRIGQVVAGPQKALQSDRATTQHCTQPVCDLDLVVDNLDDVAGADSGVWVRWRTERALGDAIEWAGKDGNTTSTNAQSLRRVAACLRVPVVGREGAADSSPGSATSWFAGNVLASGDFAASAKFTRSASPVPPLFSVPWQPTIRTESRTTIRHSRWRIASSRLEISDRRTLYSLHSLGVIRELGSSDEDSD